MLVRPDSRAVDHLNIGIAPMRDGSQDAAPDDRTTPPHEVVVADRVGTSLLRQVPPWRLRPQVPDDSVQNPPIVDTSNTSGLARQDRLDKTPRDVGEGIALSEGSFSELESRQESLPRERLRP